MIKYLVYPVRAVFSIYGFLVFISLMFLVFPLAIIASFFGKIRGGNFIYDISRFWANASMFLWGMPHKNTFEHPHDVKKQYVFIFNHISYVDIPVIFKAIRKQHFRVLGKASLAKIPVFGFFYRNGAVMVDRSSAENRAKSLIELKSIIGHDISVVIAPEGTFNMTNRPLKEFYDGAFKIAIETQTPLKPILFLDAYDRLNYKSIFSLNPGKSRAVFLEEIPVNGLTMDDVPLLKQKVFALMEQRLIHYQATWISNSTKFPDNSTIS